MIVPGLYSDSNLCAVGADSRLSGTLLSIHIYGMFGDSHTTEAAWVSDFERQFVRLCESCRAHRVRGSHEHGRQL